MVLYTAPGGTPGKAWSMNAFNPGDPDGISSDEPGGEMPDASWPMQLAGPAASAKAAPPMNVTTSPTARITNTRARPRRDLATLTRLTPLRLEHNVNSVSAVARTLREPSPSTSSGKQQELLLYYPHDGSKGNSR